MDRFWKGLLWENLPDLLDLKNASPVAVTFVNSRFLFKIFSGGLPSPRKPGGRSIEFTSQKVLVQRSLAKKPEVFSQERCIKTVQQFLVIILRNQLCVSNVFPIIDRVHICI